MPTGRGWCLNQNILSCLTFLHSLVCCALPGNVCLFCWLLSWKQASVVENMNNQIPGHTTGGWGRRKTGYGWFAQGKTLSLTVSRIKSYRCWTSVRKHEQSKSNLSRWKYKTRGWPTVYQGGETCSLFLAACQFNGAHLSWSTLFMQGMSQKCGQEIFIFDLSANMHILFFFVLPTQNQWRTVPVLLCILCFF